MSDEIAEYKEYFTALHHLLSVAHHELEGGHPNLLFLAAIKDKIADLSK